MSRNVRNRISIGCGCQDFDVLEFKFLRIQLNQLNWRDFLEAAESSGGGFDVEDEDRAERSGEGEGGMFAIVGIAYRR